MANETATQNPTVTKLELSNLIAEFLYNLLEWLMSDFCDYDYDDPQRDEECVNATGLHMSEIALLLCGPNNPSEQGEYNRLVNRVSMIESLLVPDVDGIKAFDLFRVALTGEANEELNCKIQASSPAKDVLASAWGESIWGDHYDRASVLLRTPSIYTFESSNPFLDNWRDVIDNMPECLDGQLPPSVARKVFADSRVMRLLMTIKPNFVEHFVHHVNYEFDESFSYLAQIMGKHDAEYYRKLRQWTSASDEAWEMACWPYWNSLGLNLSSVKTAEDLRDSFECYLDGSARYPVLPDEAKQFLIKHQDTLFLRFDDPSPALLETARDEQEGNVLPKPCWDLLVKAYGEVRARELVIQKTGTYRPTSRDRAQFSAWSVLRTKLKELDAVGVDCKSLDAVVAYMLGTPDCDVHVAARRLRGLSVADEVLDDELRAQGL